jgi:fatty acid desaturase
MGVEGGLNAMILLLSFFFFLPILPIGVWMIGVAALKVAADLADMADEEGNNADPAGKRKFFLDEDE